MDSLFDFDPYIMKRRKYYYESCDDSSSDESDIKSTGRYEGKKMFTRDLSFEEPPKPKPVSFFRDALRDAFLNEGVYSSESEEDKKQKDNINDKNIIFKNIISNMSMNQESDFPPLTYDGVLINIRVISELKPGYKLMLSQKEDGTFYLNIDNTYFQGYTRWVNGQGREKIIKFLEHLISETNNCTQKILYDIKSGMNVNDNMIRIQKINTDIDNCLNNFDTIKVAYEGNSETCSRINQVKTNLNLFRDGLTRELASIAKKSS